MSQPLAINGGTPVRDINTKPWTKWPFYDKTEEEALLRVLHSDNWWYMEGTEGKTFETEFAEMHNAKYAVACVNGSAALEVSLRALGIGCGDEVIVPPYTFIATVAAVLTVGATPIFVDIEGDTLNIDPTKIEEAITPRTKAIVPVHLFGQCAPMEEIMAVAKEHGLYVIEDTAQAIGADYHFSDGSKKKAGTIGTAGCTSFFPSKNLGCYGDGGAIYTNDDELGKKIRMIANHGQSVQYYHDEVGVNSRLDSIQAAILRIKLRHLDHYATSRRSVADYYDKAFAGHSKVITPVRAKYSDHVFHQYTLVLNGIDRTAMRDFLASRDIPSMIYYPVPLHLQKAYTDIRYKAGDFPVTEWLCANVISLPIHTEMDEETLNFISTNVLEFLNR